LIILVTETLTLAKAACMDHQCAPLSA
jgi:hypothetical protein